MRFFRILLLPVSLLYSLVLQLRHWLYNRKILKSYGDFAVPVICVGNLNLGGTGKTPFTEFLVRHLAPEIPLAVLSRGYGRSVRGFLYADSTSTAAEIGDEPCQMRANFGDSVVLAVCEDRREGIERLISDIPGLGLIILDDAFQHRKINADINILLTDYKEPFYNDLLVPAGSLRDIHEAYRRADFVVVTRSPEEPDPSHMRQSSAFTGRRQGEFLFYARIRYRPLKNPLTGEEISSGKKVLLVTGIANPAHLVRHLEEGHEVVRHLNYRDHYNYTGSSLENIRKIFDNFAGPETIIVTTEKDFVKIKPLLGPSTASLPWSVASIEYHLGGDEARFFECLQEGLKNNNE